MTLSAMFNLVLRGCILVERVLHRDAHGLQGANCLLAQIPGDVGGGEVEERRLVQRSWRTPFLGRSEIEELDVGRDEEVESESARLVQVASQHLAGITAERRAIQIVDVAEHAGLGSVAVGPGQHHESVGVGDGQNVTLLNARETIDGRTIEAHAVLEGVLQFGGADGEALQIPQDVGEPQTNQPHTSFLDGAEHVITLLLQHVHSFSLPMDTRIGTGKRETGKRGNGKGAGLPRPPQ
jgi:hypothetical protein